MKKLSNEAKEYIKYHKDIINENRLKITLGIKVMSGLFTFTNDKLIFFHDGVRIISWDDYDSIIIR